MDYPLLLADNNVGGDVLLQFVVNERGRVDSTTIKALKSGHDLFLRAARTALLRWRARPAQLRGRPVRQVTTHAFCFQVGGMGAVARCERDLARHGAAAMSVACTEGGRTVAYSHGGVQHIPASRPPDVRCT